MTTNQIQINGFAILQPISSEIGGWRKKGQEINPYEFTERCKWTLKSHRSRNFVCSQMTPTHVFIIQSNDNDDQLIITVIAYGTAYSIKNVYLHRTTLSIT
ncbi:hypothetical protein LIER_38181 [Lithospermum erythrorhizon]|uniref:Uncharacterized protein n=1 Tax=Lithospermum erythrorhizon TaxID=34254 RepID=A0AAV3PXC0_LITER